MKKIIVLGGSFGGLTAALELRRLLGRDAEITLVSGDDRFVFMPSLPWLIMGQRRPQDITLKVPDILAPRNIGFICLHCEPQPDAVDVLLKLLILYQRCRTKQVGSNTRTYIGLAIIVLRLDVLGPVQRALDFIQVDFKGLTDHRRQHQRDT